MKGLEHKDSRLHAAEGADWRDKLAELRRDLPGDDRDDTEDAADTRDEPELA